jgi:hypothetical protein
MEITRQAALLGRAVEIRNNKNSDSMEHLFSTNIAVNNEKVAYQVVFDHEQYEFTPESENKSFPAFSFRREHDEWVDEDLPGPEIKKQALEALEKYLLKQH